MKFIVIAVVILVLYLVFVYFRIGYVYGHAGNPKIMQKDLELGQGPALRYIAAGDSLALGEGASSVEKTYAYQLAEHFAKTSRVQYKNIAVSGARTSDVINNQLDQIIVYDPDIVTITIGGNDQTHLASSNQILKNLQQIINTLTEKTRATIYMSGSPNLSGATLLPWFYIRLIEHQSKSLNPQILKLETKRVKIINIHDFGWDQFPSRKPTYSADQFHPSDLGYQNWTNAFLDKIMP